MSLQSVYRGYFLFLHFSKCFYKGECLLILVCKDFLKLINIFKYILVSWSWCFFNICIKKGPRLGKRLKLAAHGTCAPSPLKCYKQAALVSRGHLLALVYNIFRNKYCIPLCQDKNSSGMYILTCISTFRALFFKFCMLIFLRMIALCCVHNLSLLYSFPTLTKLLRLLNKNEV